MSNKVKKNKKGYGYQYTDIAQVHDYLEEIGASYYQYIETIDGIDYIMTVPIIEGKELPPRRGCRVVQATLQGVKNPAQEQGSALTYARRYSLFMAFGLATEDDDAQSLSEKVEVNIETANSYTFNFGKHKGKTMKELLEEDLDYVNWFINNKADDYAKQCYELLTGEKLPTNEEQDSRIELITEIHNLELELDKDHDDILEYYKVESEKDLTMEQLNDCHRLLKSAKIKKDKGE